MNQLRQIPSVDQVLRDLGPIAGLPREIVVEQIRAELNRRRETIEAGTAVDGSVSDAVRSHLQALTQLQVRRVINATGVVLHTNLGRAPLGAFQPVEGYSDLEFSLETGERGKRDDHIVPLLEALLGRPAIAVNNNAAAVHLVLQTLAAGQEVIVSRGELIEIGDGFRIPEIMKASGAILREVGTTNRTHLADYRDAISPATRLILRVHPSNFHVTGFTARPSLRELSELGREHGIPVYEDLGSGCLVDLRPYGIDEPLVGDSLAAGVDLVSFSCDKLLGGPQAGIIAGDAALIKRLRRNPMYRAFRLDKLAIEAMQHTLQKLLRRDWNALPALRMILASLDEIEQRARRVAAALNSVAISVRQTESPIGGGSTPDQQLPSWALEIAAPRPHALQKALRLGAIPVVGRIEHGSLLLDMRTVTDGEEADLVTQLLAALSRSSEP